MSSSWKLDSSQTIQRPSSSSSVSARPMFPATGAPSISPRSAVVVVFPFVPVTPRIGVESSRPPSSISLQTGMPRSRAAVTRGASGRHPRALDQDVDSLQQRGLLGSEVDFDAGLGEPAGIGLRGAVHGHDAIAPPRERQRRRPAGPRQPEHEVGHPTRSGRKAGK